MNTPLGLFGGQGNRSHVYFGVYEPGETVIGGFGDGRSRRIVMDHDPEYPCYVIEDVMEMQDMHARLHDEYITLPNWSLKSQQRHFFVAKRGEGMERFDPTTLKRVTEKEFFVD